LVALLHGERKEGFDECRLGDVDDCIQIEETLLHELLIVDL
jgi:hypothetical protein